MRNSRKLSVEPATRHNRNRRTAALSSTDWSIPGNCAPFLKSLSERPDHAGDRPYEYPQQHSSTCVLGDGRHVEVLLRSYCDHRRAGRRAGASPRSAPPPASKALSHTVCTLAAPRRQAVRTDRISCKNCAKLSCAERRSLIDRNSRTHSCKPLDDSMGAVSATRSHSLCTGRTTRALRFQSVHVHLRIHFGRSRTHRRVHAHAVLWRRCERRA